MPNANTASNNPTTDIKAVFIAAGVLAPWRRRQLLLVVLAMSVLGLLLGLMQLAGGPDSPLRFYDNTNRSEAVGWFANRNHLAALLVMALPLSIVLAVQQLSARLGGREVSLLSVVAGAGTAVLIILGIALTRSRAGVMLGIAALVLSLPILMTVRRRQGSKRLFSAIVIVALVLTVQFALYGVLARFEADPMADLRWQIAAKTLGAADEHLPLGAGLGSFPSAFATADAETPSSTIINHAHNDYLELWFEAGWLFPAVGGVFLAYILVVGAQAWRHARDHTITLWSTAASMSLVLGLVHSAADYPLRTTAFMSVVGLLLAVLALGISKHELHWLRPRCGWHAGQVDPARE